MSTQRVEVNPDDNSQTLEQSAEQLQKDGLTLTENGTVSATENTTSVSEPDTNIQSSEDRPEWLPEKFQSAEDLAKAYSELEKKLSNPQEQQATEEQPTKEEVEQETGITLDKYYDEWVEKGELGQESYAELEKAMENKNDPNYKKYLEIRNRNLHKMEPIPVCKFNES